MNHTNLIKKLSKFKKQKKHPLISLFAIYMMLYHWITLSSMIILMLFIRRNLRLKILHMLHNGLIILAYEDGKLFTRLVCQVWWLWFPYSQFFCLTVYLRSGWFCSDDLFWFQTYWNRDIPRGLHFRNFMVVTQTKISHLCVTYV